MSKHKPMLPMLALVADGRCMTYEEKKRAAAELRNAETACRVLRRICGEWRKGPCRLNTAAAAFRALDALMKTPETT